MACFTQKSFSFINAKKMQFKENLLKAVEIVGSREELIAKFSKDLGQLLVPSEVEQKEVVEKGVDELLRSHIGAVIEVMADPPEEDITDRVMNHIKLMYCESIMAISRQCPNLGTFT